MQEFDPDALLQEMAVKSASEASGVSPNKIKNVIKAEGSGPSAISPKGAQGTMQLMPPIQKAYGVTNPNDPTQNINAGTQFLADLTKQYRQMYPNISDAQLEQAVYAHYNGGWKNGKAVAEGKAPISSETKAYLNKINEVNPDDLLAEMSTPQISQENIVLPESLGSSSKFAVDKYKSQGRVQPEQPGFTPYVQDKTAPRVAANSAVRSLSAGFIQPEWATKEETLAHPVADVLGSAAGFAPYTLVPGGLPTAMGVSGVHSGVQTAVEGGSPTDIALATGIGAAAPGVGKLVGKGLSSTVGKIPGKVANLLGGNVSPEARAATNTAFENAWKTDAAIEKAYESGVPEAELRKLFPNYNLGATEREITKNLTGSLYGITGEQKKAAFKTATSDAVKDFATSAGLGGTIGSLGALYTGQDPLMGFALGSGGMGLTSFANAGLRSLMKNPEVMQSFGNYIGHAVTDTKLGNKFAQKLMEMASPKDMTSSLQYGDLVKRAYTKALQSEGKLTPLQIEAKASIAGDKAAYDFEQRYTQAQAQKLQDLGIARKLGGMLGAGMIPK